MYTLKWCHHCLMKMLKKSYRNPYYYYYYHPPPPPLPPHFCCDYCQHQLCPPPSLACPQYH